MSTEKYPAELVEKLREALNEADGDYSAREQRADAGGGDMEPGDWFTFLAAAALDALDLTVTERWQAEWRGRMGVSACATDSRENATVLAGEGGTVRRRTEMRAETPWEVVTDEHVSNR